MNCIYCGREVKGNLRKDCDIICGRCAMRLVKYIQGLEKEFKVEIKNKRQAMALEQKRAESAVERRKFEKIASKGSTLYPSINSSLWPSEGVLGGNFKGVSDPKEWWKAWGGINRAETPLSWNDLLREI